MPSNEIIFCDDDNDKEEIDDAHQDGSYEVTLEIPSTSSNKK